MEAGSCRTLEGAKKALGLYFWLCDFLIARLPLLRATLDNVTEGRSVPIYHFAVLSYPAAFVDSGPAWLGHVRLNPLCL